MVFIRHFAVFFVHRREARRGVVGAAPYRGCLFEFVRTLQADLRGVVGAAPYRVCANIAGTYLAYRRGDQWSPANPAKSNLVRGIPYAHSRREPCGRIWNPPLRRIAFCSLRADMSCRRQPPPPAESGVNIGRVLPVCSAFLSTGGAGLVFARMDCPVIRKTPRRFPGRCNRAGCRTPRRSRWRCGGSFSGCALCRRGQSARWGYAR